MIEERNNPDDSWNTDEIAPELKELLEKIRTRKVEDPLQIQQTLAELIKESDRGAALIAVAFLDFLLALLIARRLIDLETADKLLGLEKGNCPLSPLAVRTELAFALGWIGPETRKELNLLRKIRNKFGHSHDVQGFEDQQIKSWCNELNPPKWQEPVPAIPVQGRSRFVFTAVKLAMRLYALVLESGRRLRSAQIRKSPRSM
ncbi:MAG: hypothetical protein JO033_28565 [Acidobacteriaceae bacterium]|nr:hypothetical protein [Acidobacteriaceae bacterium]